MEQGLTPIRGSNKEKMVSIWAICKFYKFKMLDCRADGMKTKGSNCLSWFGYVKYVENMHYLHDKKDLWDAITYPKAYCGTI